MVVATKPGTTVPVRVVRDRQEKTLNVTVDELDLEAEGNACTRGNGERGDDPAAGDEQRLRHDAAATSRPTIARRLRLDRQHAGRGGRRRRAGQPRGARRPRDRATSSCASAAQPIANAADASRELGRVPSGGTAFLRVLRERSGDVRHGDEGVSELELRRGLLGSQALQGRLRVPLRPLSFVIQLRLSRRPP